jgi:hypothetical protein
MSTDRTDHLTRRHTNRPHTLLTLHEAAAVARAPAATLGYWRHLGVGPRSFKVGRHVVYDEGDLYEWIDAQRTSDDPGAA